MTDRSLSCDEARRALWPDPSMPALAEARAHLDACASCQGFFRAEAALRRRLERIERPGAPDALRERVVAALEAEPVPRRRSRVWGWIGTGVAAAAALVVAVGTWEPPAEPLATQFVIEATRALPPADAYRSTELNQVEQWLAEQVGRDIPLPDITGATILGGRVVELEGAPAVAAVYEYQGMPLTYFAVSADELAGQRLAIEAGIRSAKAEGYEVAIWAEAGGLRAVAGPLPRDQLQAVARECRDKALARPL